MRVGAARALVAAPLVALAAAAGCQRAAAPEAAPPPNLLLVTIDTLRADRLGRGFTPTLDALASGGLRFERMRSTVPLTLPAHASILTGTWPAAHGARLNGQVVPPGAPTLASLLGDAGYQTRAIVGAFVLDRRFGLARGFDEYDDRIARDPSAMDRLQAERPASEVVDRALGLLPRLEPGKPWFLWVHVYDPHAPYDPPADALARAAGDRYNGEVAFVDAQLARLVAAVDTRPDAGRTAMLVVGDHGESLGDHGEPTHGMLLTDAALVVPFIVRAPGVAPAVRRDAASLVDLLPTAMALTGRPAPPGTGRNLLAGADADREVYAETEYPALAGWTPLQALVRDRWKAVRGVRTSLFDLASDPGETADVSAAHASLATGMSVRLDEIRERSASGPRGSGGVSPEVAARLRSLGYLAPAGAAARADRPGVDPASMMGAWAAFEEALALMNGGQAKAALASLARLAEAHPASPLFHSTHARALAEAGQPRAALDRLRAAVKRWPADAALYHDLAGVARGLGLAAEAARAEDAALALDGSAPAARNGKGLLLADAGRHADALVEFAAAVAADPTNAVYLANRGNAERATGKLAAAAASFRLALDRSPALPDALNGLAVVLVELKQPAEAIGWLERAVAADPAFVEAKLNLGIALQEAGDARRAREVFEQVAAAKGPYARERAAARALLAGLGPP